MKAGPDNAHKLFELFAQANPSLTGTWQNTPGQPIGVLLTLVQTGTSVSGSGTLWDPSNPSKRHPLVFQAETTAFRALT